MFMRKESLKKKNLKEKLKRKSKKKNLKENSRGVDPQQLTAEPPLLATLPEDPDLLRLAVVHQFYLVDPDHDAGGLRSNRAAAAEVDSENRMIADDQVTRLEGIDIGSHMSSYPHLS
jgi:hypothetical protein